MMKNDNKSKMKKYDIHNLDNNIDMILPIDEIEINGVQVMLSKLDDYSQRVYNTSDVGISEQIDIQGAINDIYNNDFNEINVDIMSNESIKEDIHANKKKARKQNKHVKQSNQSQVVKNKLDQYKSISKDEIIEKESIVNLNNINDDISSDIKVEVQNDIDNDINNNIGDNIEVEAQNNKPNKKPKDKAKKVEKKLSKKDKIKLAISISLLISGGLVGNKIYKEYKIEQERLASFAKENLDLKLIIDTVDEYGENTYQLDWQEVASILGVITKNRPEEITKSQIENICDLFIDEDGDILHLWQVASLSDFSDKEEKRAYKYKYDLETYGYMPERLEYDSPQMIFINSIKEGAIKSYKETGILPSITIAQAILESNWGNSSLTKESNNLFGIKADPSWDGEFVIFETKEYHSQMIKDKFRKYDTIEESIMDHSKFLKENNRYTEGGVFEAKTYKTQALALQESGYSTAEDENGNKTYASMLEQLIRQYNLQIIDAEVKRY